MHVGGPGCGVVLGLRDGLGSVTDGGAGDKLLLPPFSFIPRVLQHVQQCKANAVIIVPEWPSQAWWVKMMQMSVGCAQFQGMTVFERVKDSRLQPVTKTISFRPLMVAIDGTVMPTLASEDRESRGEGCSIKVRNSFRVVL